MYVYNVQVVVGDWQVCVYIVGGRVAGMRLLPSFYMFYTAAAGGDDMVYI